MKYAFLALCIAFALTAQISDLPPRDIMTRGILTLADFKLRSPEFLHNGPIPRNLTCDGKNLSPILEWDGVAQTVEEFALIVDDPDAPGKEPFVHWVIYNIPLSTRGILKQLKRAPSLIDGTKQGTNSFGNIGWDGPCPPKKDRAHQYIFTLYALDKKISLAAGATKAQLLKAMKAQGSIAQTTQLIGTYQRARR